MASDIGTRMRHYFARQIAWSETTLEALEGIDAIEDEEAAGAFLKGDGERARDLESLEQEFAALKKEWEAASDVPEAEREAVSELARRAEALSEEVRTQMTEAVQELTRRAESDQREVDALRRGRRDARKFAGGDESSGGFVDRQA